MLDTEKQKLKMMIILGLQLISHLDNGVCPSVMFVEREYADTHGEHYARTATQ